MLIVINLSTSFYTTMSTLYDLDCESRKFKIELNRHQQKYSKITFLTTKQQKNVQAFKIIKMLPNIISQFISRF